MNSANAMQPVSYYVNRLFRSEEEGQEMYDSISTRESGALTEPDVNNPWHQPGVGNTPISVSSEGAEYKGLYYLLSPLTHNWLTEETGYFPRAFSCHG